ncbi:TraB/GumN family protein [Sphingomonas xanthus]|uniref:TraB/GumN family protein n=1 Tax=Sphingomonas xanthus TaxID=2594473 RepID=A0A516ITG7_9SPHN|nr:TraB/GumN family protein [Sphingomonas xanthus]QDP20160.1 TraB/GumN family protein [Sphingomonas xanthus]
MSLFKRFERKLAWAGAVAAIACAAPAVAESKPAMWKVADADTTIYLFGTIHLLPDGTQWRSPAFDAAATASDTLVIETVIDETNPAATVGEMFKLAVSPGLPPLADRVDAAHKDALSKAIAKSGLPAPIFDKLETWAAAFMLLGVQFKDLGLQPGSGVESALKKQFSEGGKTVGQLETNAEQFGYFDTLSEAAQRKFLEGVLDDPAAMKKEFGGMLDAWIKGDVAGIAKSFNVELDEAPELMDALIRKRNLNWTAWVKQRMDQPGTVMVAVGAGHLAGDHSVVSMLEKQGVKVTRVQ